MPRRPRRVTVSAEFEQATEIGRRQARRADSSWAGRLRDHKAPVQVTRTFHQLLTSRNRPSSRTVPVKQEKQRKRAAGRRGPTVKVEEGKPKVEPGSHIGKRGLSHSRLSKLAAKQSLPAGRTSSKPQRKSRRGKQASRDSTVFDFHASQEIEDATTELPSMAEEDLGAYAEVLEETVTDKQSGKDGKGNGGNHRRLSDNPAGMYGKEKKRGLSPKTPRTPDASKVSNQPKENGASVKDVPRDEEQEEARAPSPQTVVKVPVGSRVLVTTPTGSTGPDNMTSPGSVRALKGHFEAGVRAELEARREEMSRQIEAQREEMKAHEAALRKQQLEAEEAKAAREQAVVEAEAYVASKKRAAEDLEQRAKRARAEAEEAETERQEAKERAEAEFNKRVEALRQEEEKKRRAIEKLKADIAERERALQAEASGEAEAVGQLVREQLAELQQKVDKLWNTQLGSPNGK